LYTLLICSGIFQFTLYDQQMQCYIMCLSHTIHHQHVSIAIATIYGVTYKNIRNASNLSKRLSDPLDIA